MGIIDTIKNLAGVKQQVQTFNPQIQQSQQQLLRQTPTSAANIQAQESQRAIAKSQAAEQIQQQEQELQNYLKSPSGIKQYATETGSIQTSTEQKSFSVGTGKDRIYTQAPVTTTTYNTPYGSYQEVDDSEYRRAQSQAEFQAEKTELGKQYLETGGIKGNYLNYMAKWGGLNPLDVAEAGAYEIQTAKFKELGLTPQIKDGQVIGFEDKIAKMSYSVDAMPNAIQQYRPQDVDRFVQAGILTQSKSQIEMPQTISTPISISTETRSLPYQERGTLTLMGTTSGIEVTTPKSLMIPSGEPMGFPRFVANIPSELGGFVERQIGRIPGGEYTIAAKNVYIPQRVTMGGPPTFNIPEYKGTIPKDIGKVTGIGTTLGIYAIPYLGQAFLGASTVTGTQEAFNPKLTTSQRIMGGIEAGTSAALLLGPSIIKTTKSATGVQEIKYYTKELKRVPYTDIGPVLEGQRISYQTSAKFKGFPATQGVLEKGMPLKDIPIGRGIIITKEPSPIASFFGAAPKIVYASTKEGVIGSYQKASQLLKNFYQPKDIPQLLRYSLQLPKTSVVGKKSAAFINDELAMTLNARGVTQKANIPGVRVTGPTGRTTASYQAEFRNAELFGVPSVQGSQAVLQIKIPKTRTLSAQELIDLDLKQNLYLQTAIGKGRKLPDVSIKPLRITGIDFGPRVTRVNLKSPRVDINYIPGTTPRRLTFVDTLTQEVKRVPKLTESGKLFGKPGKLGPLEFSYSKVRTFKPLRTFEEKGTGSDFSKTFFNPSKKQIQTQTQMLKEVTPQIQIPKPKIPKQVLPKTSSAIVTSAKQFSKNLGRISAIPAYKTLTNTAQLEYPSLKTAQETTQQSKTIQQELLKTNLLTSELTLTAPQSKQAVREQVTQLTPQISLQAPRLQTRLVQAEAVSPRLITPNVSVVKIINPVPPPQIAIGDLFPTKPKIRINKTNPKVKSGLFTVEFRRRGKFFPIAKTPNVPSGIQIGKSAARTTLGASFRIIKPSGGVVSLIPTQEFRSGKGQGILVQRAPARLTSKSERKEIAQSRKAGVKLWKTAFGSVR